MENIRKKEKKKLLSCRDSQKSSSLLSRRHGVGGSAPA